MNKRSKLFYIENKKKFVFYFPLYDGYSKLETFGNFVC